MSEPDTTHRVLAAVAAADLHDTVWWRVDGGYAPVTFFVVCNDVFAWGTADAEPITSDTIDAFEAAIEDVKAVTDGDATFGPMLYAARRRHCRPQGGAYPSDRRVWALFDACGPERELDNHNPTPAPEKASREAFTPPANPPVASAWATDPATTGGLAAAWVADPTPSSSGDCGTASSDTGSSSSFDGGFSGGGDCG